MARDGNESDREEPADGEETYVSDEELEAMTVEYDRFCNNWLQHYGRDWNIHSMLYGIETGQRLMHLGCRLPGGAQDGPYKAETGFRVCSFAALVQEGTSFTSLLLRESTDLPKRLIYVNAHKAVYHFLLVQIQMHTRERWSAAAKASMLSVAEQARDGLQWVIEQLSPWRVELQSWGRREGVYCEALIEELYQLRNIQMLTVAEMKNIPENITRGPGHMRESTPICCACISKGSPPLQDVGSWHNIIHHVRDVLCDVFMHIWKVKALHEREGSKCETTTAVLSTMIKAFTTGMSVDHLFFSWHPFLIRIGPKIMRSPLFRRNAGEKARRLLFVAYELWRADVNLALERVGILDESLRLDVFPRSPREYNGFAGGIGLLQELDEQRFRHQLEPYGIKADDIGRAMWF
jgi:hypothetical protein